MLRRAVGAGVMAGIMAADDNSSPKRKIGIYDSEVEANPQQWEEKGSVLLEPVRIVRTAVWSLLDSARNQGGALSAQLVTLKADANTGLHENFDESQINIAVKSSPFVAGFSTYGVLRLMNSARWKRFIVPTAVLCSTAAVAYPSFTDNVAALGKATMQGTLGDTIKEQIVAESADLRKQADDTVKNLPSTPKFKDIQEIVSDIPSMVQRLPDKVRSLMDFNSSTPQAETEQVREPEPVVLVDPDDSIDPGQSNSEDTATYSSRRQSSE